MTYKEELLKSIANVPDEDLPKSTVKLSIHMPTGEIETITNPNIRDKAAYIERAYDDDLHLKTCKDIYIADYEVWIDFRKGVPFGEAIEMLKAGYAVRRRGWNGKGIFIKLQRPDEHSKMTSPYIYIDTTGLLTDNPDAPRSCVPWLASQTDMLSEDWEFAEPPHPAF